MNNITLMGRVTADVELKRTTGDIPFCNFTIAVDRPHSKDVTDFIRCIAWRNTAEFIAKYFYKGKLIALNGMLTSRSWKDNSGNNHSINEVLIDSVEFCGDKAKQNQTQEQANDVPNGFEAVRDDDMPF